MLVHIQCSVLLLVTFNNGIFCKAGNLINWIQASQKCQNDFESELITEQYIEEQNHSAEIIKELEGASAWIDGQIRSNCIKTQEKICLNITRMHTKTEERAPYICLTGDTSDGLIISQESYTLEEASQKCNTSKRHHWELYLTEANEVLEKTYALTGNVKFWLPNVDIHHQIDRNLCYSVKADKNMILKRTPNNCTIPMMGICINKTYIEDYQVATMLEVRGPKKLRTGSLSNQKAESSTPSGQPEKPFKTIDDKGNPEALKLIGTTAKILKETQESGEVVQMKPFHEQFDLKSVLPYIFSGFNLILFICLAFCMLHLWRRMLKHQKYQQLLGTSGIDPTCSNSLNSRQVSAVDSTKRKHKSKKTKGPMQYEGFSDSTRVKIPEETEEENPYSEILHKRDSAALPVCTTDGAWGGPMDVSDSPKRGFGSFKLGKTSFNNSHHNAGYMDMSEASQSILQKL